MVLLGGGDPVSDGIDIGSPRSDPEFEGLGTVPGMVLAEEIGAGSSGSESEPDTGVAAGTLACLPDWLH